MKLILIAIGVLLGIYLSYEYPDIAAQIWGVAWDWFLVVFNWLEEKISRL